MIKATGIPSEAQIKSKFPKTEQLYKPKAIVGCYQEIPCNPCSTSCPTDAITIGSDINQIPEIDFNKCTGCAMCVYSCPGLAIMTAQIKDDRAYFKIPYELLPLPEKGDIWQGINYKGEYITDAVIENVQTNNRYDRTAIITASVKKQYLYDFVTVRCPK